MMFRFRSTWDLTKQTQLADMLIKISGKKIEKKYLPAGPAGCMRRNSDNTKIHKLTGWKPSYPLEQGLKNTYEHVETTVGSDKR